MKKKTSYFDGQFVGRLIEMLESPVFRVLSLSAIRALHCLEIEWARHGGTRNGNLIVTFAQLNKYGIHWNAIAPAIRELVALGLVEITEQGRAGNAFFRRPTQYRVTYLPTSEASPTHEWRQITEDDAKMIAQGARRPGSNSGHTTETVVKQIPSIGNRSTTTTETVSSLATETVVTSLRKPYRKVATETVSLSRSSPSTALRAEAALPPAVRAEPEPSPTGKSVVEHLLAVKAEPTAIARAETMLEQLSAEAARLHGKHEFSVADDARLIVLRSQIPNLEMQIRTAKQFVNGG